MRRRTGAAALALVALLATACPSRPQEDGQPVPGGRLVVAVRDLGSLDPVRATGRGSLGVVSHLFDPLTTVDPITGILLPAAASRWSASRDQRTWTFELGESTYSDGTPVTAADFEFAFDRIAQRSSASVYAPLLEPVVGYRDTHDRGTMKSLAGVSASGKRLIIKLERAFAELPLVLAHPAFAPLPPAYRRSTRGLASKPIGNGPFRVESFEAEKRVVLVRNPAYPRATPLLESMEFRVVDSIDDGWREFLGGRVHVAEAPQPVVAGAGDRYGDGGFTPGWATLSFGVNMRLKKYARPEVRRAISMAIDRSAIASGIFGETKTPATGIIPRGVRGYREDVCTSCTLKRDEARATIRRVLGAAPVAITVDHLSDAASRSVARAVAADLNKVGFRASLRAHSQKEYRELLARGGADLAELGWLADVPSPDAFLARQLYTGSPDNQTKFRDAAFDKLVDQARAQPDEEKRLELYRRAEQRALQLMPLIPIVFFRNRTAVSENVRRFTLDGAGMFDGTAVWLDPS